VLLGFSQVVTDFYCLLLSGSGKGCGVGYCISQNACSEGVSYVSHTKTVDIQIGHWQGNALPLEQQGAVRATLNSLQPHVSDKETVLKKMSKRRTDRELGI
jgi:hypothetical protein